MAQHIGIAGCSAEGTALCYRTICAEGAELFGPYAHPEISINTPPLADYVSCLEKGDMEGVADIILSSAAKLASAGADFLICPDNTVHQAFHRVLPKTPLPWLHIADVVAGQAVRSGYRRLGLTGTKWLVESDVYPDRLAAHGLLFERPDTADRSEVHRIIMDELVHGRIEPRSVETFQKIIERLSSRGCDAVILGCTELPLLISGSASSLPTLDSTRLLARAALVRSREGPPQSQGSVSEEWSLG